MLKMVFNLCTSNDSSSHCQIVEVFPVRNHLINTLGHRNMCQIVRKNIINVLSSTHYTENTSKFPLYEYLSFRMNISCKIFVMSNMFIKSLWRFFRAVRTRSGPCVSFYWEQKMCISNFLCLFIYVCLTPILCCICFWHITSNHNKIK